MKYIKTTFASAAVFAFAMTANAEQININTPSAAYSLDSSGTVLKDSAAGPFTFGLGSFGAFTPTLDNVDSWASNWTAAFSADLVAAGPPSQIGRLNSTQAFNVESLVGSQAFIFGYNSLDVAATSQWILVTNDAWTFPAINPLATSAGETWSPAAAGTSSIIGSADATNMQFADVQAIPEPSTYALIFGLGILGFLGFRRVRK